MKKATHLVFQLSDNVNNYKVIQKILLVIAELKKIQLGLNYLTYHEKLPIMYANIRV